MPGLDETLTGFGLHLDCSGAGFEPDWSSVQTGFRLDLDWIWATFAWYLSHVQARFDLIFGINLHCRITSLLALTSRRPCLCLHYRCYYCGGVVLSSLFCWLQIQMDVTTRNAVVKFARYASASHTLRDTETFYF